VPLPALVEFVFPSAALLELALTGALPAAVEDAARQAWVPWRRIVGIATIGILLNTASSRSISLHFNRG
jgi:hypothetical protein